MLGAVSPDSFDTLHSYSNTFQMPFVTPWFPEKVNKLCFLSFRFLIKVFLLYFLFYISYLLVFTTFDFLELQDINNYVHLIKYTFIGNSYVTALGFFMELRNFIRFEEFICFYTICLAQIYAILYD